MGTKGKNRLSARMRKYGNHPTLTDGQFFERIASIEALENALARALRDTGLDFHAVGCIDNPTDRPCCWVFEARAALARSENAE